MTPNIDDILQLFDKKYKWKKISKSDYTYQSYLYAKLQLRKNKIKPYTAKKVKHIFQDKYFANIFVSQMKEFQTSLLYKSTIHGYNHNIRVAIIGFACAILEKYPITSIPLILDAAKYHDIGRVDDTLDDGHGYRSAQNIDFLKQKYSQKDFNVLQTIITAHSIDDNLFLNVVKHNKITDVDYCTKFYNILKDADGLDRVRLEDPTIKIEFIRTKSAKKLILWAYELYYNYQQKFKK